jgi:hypothetical protein
MTWDALRAAADAAADEVQPRPEAPVGHTRAAVAALAEDVLAQAFGEVAPTWRSR